MHLVATLKNRTDDHEISARAARQGLWAMPLSVCALSQAARPSPKGLVLGYGGTNVQEIREGVRRLGGVLRSSG